MFRREVLKGIGAFATIGAFLPGCCEEPGGGLVGVNSHDGNNDEAVVKFGLIADLHYADRDQLGKRHYRDSLAKLKEAVEIFKHENCDFIVELGDFKDQEETADEGLALGFLQDAEELFLEFGPEVHHVLGNHDMDVISKEQFLAGVTNSGQVAAKAYYTFSHKGVQFFVLDANYLSDGSDYSKGNFDWTDTNIPQPQLDWLKVELACATGPAIIFVHQRLDGEGSHYVNNADQVRGILEDSGRVVAVFQGHDHPGGYSRINGIEYWTLPAAVDGQGLVNGSYAIVKTKPGGVAFEGYRQAGVLSNSE